MGACMKNSMKKGLFCALLVLVASVSAYAKMPLEFSGNIKLGYDFNLTDGKWVAYPWNNTTTKSGSGKMAGYMAHVVVKNDFFDLTLDPTYTPTTVSSTSVASSVQGFADGYLNAWGHVYIGNIIKDSGIDIGGFDLVLAGGNDGTKYSLSVYADPFGTLSWNSYKLSCISNYAFSVKLSWAQYIDLFVTCDPTRLLNATKNTDSYMASLRVTPMTGLRFTGGYAGYSANKHTENGHVAKENNGAVYGQGIANFQKLFDMSFPLRLSLDDSYYLTEKLNYLSVALETGYKDFYLDTEWQYWNQYHNLLARLSWRGVEALDLSLKLKVENLNPSATYKTAYTLTPKVDYTVHDITFGLETEYAFETKVLDLKPYVKYSF